MVAVTFLLDGLNIVQNALLQKSMNNIAWKCCASFARAMTSLTVSFRRDTALPWPSWGRLDLDGPPGCQAAVALFNTARSISPRFTGWPIVSAILKNTLGTCSLIPTHLPRADPGFRQIPKRLSVNVCGSGRNSRDRFAMERRSHASHQATSARLAFRVPF